jgi:hypothetical protein
MQPCDRSLVVVAASGDIICIVMLPKACRDSHWKVDHFKGDRVRWSDEQFLKECNNSPASDLARTAVAVRRCVADVGLIDSMFIRPNDCFPGNLDVLPLWESMDFIDLVLRIQDELSVEWTDRQDTGVLATPFTVLELIQRIQAVAVPFRAPAAT